MSNQYHFLSRFAFQIWIIPCKGLTSFVHSTITLESRTNINIFFGYKYDKNRSLLPFVDMDYLQLSL